MAKPEARCCIQSVFEYIGFFIPFGFSYQKRVAGPEPVERSAFKASPEALLHLQNLGGTRRPDSFSQPLKIPR